MNIIFLNTWAGTRKKDISKFLKEQSLLTDIFCFQEFRDEMPALCREILADYTEMSLQKPSMYEAICARKNIPILASGSLLQNDPHIGSGCYIKIRHKEDTMYVCNIHGWPWPGDKLDDNHRLKQSEKILEFFKDKEGLKIIGGDFNLLPDTESVKMFEEHGYRNLVKEFNVQTTRDHLSWDRFPSKQLFADYVFVSPEVKVKSFSVPHLEISDHLPLILEVD